MRTQRFSPEAVRQGLDDAQLGLARADDLEVVVVILRRLLRIEIVGRAPLELSTDMPIDSAARRLARRMRLSRSLNQMNAGTESSSTCKSPAEVGGPARRRRVARRRAGLIASIGVMPWMPHIDWLAPSGRPIKCRWGTRRKSHDSSPGSPEPNHLKCRATRPEPQGTSAWAPARQTSCRADTARVSVPKALCTVTCREGSSPSATV